MVVSMMWANLASFMAIGLTLTIEGDRCGPRGSSG